MKIFPATLLTLSTAAVALLGACSDDPDQPDTTTSTTSSTGSGSGGAGGQDVQKPIVDFTGPVDADMTLTADNDYLMKGIVFVESGATLTIEAGTRILGEKVSLATLVIEPGAKIHAKGTADAPIVFTSQGERGDRSAGDWGGVMLLGRAPINVPGGQAQVEGITGDGTLYGGNDPADNSGVLEYVRIEFSGILLSPDNEVNGLTLAGVGAGTTLDHVMVHHTLDDCFEFFGGTVNAKHLLCAYNGDDGFDWDFGYHGKLQFLAAQQDPSVADDTNGFEGDNDADGSANAPLSEPTMYNVTLCGKNADVDKQQYGMLLRRSTRGHFFNMIVTGFEAGVDIRDALTSVEMKSSIFFGNVTQNIAYAETDTDPANKANLDYDDDGGLDEVAWILDPANMNSEMDPKLGDCFHPGGPDFLPEATLTDMAATPPDDGFFDASASYIGAFQAGDTWATGAWVSYDLN